MDTEKAYNAALDYLYSFVDYSLKHASELAKAEFNLDRMFALMAELGNPQDAYPILHVAGTKGKGSVCALAASALQAAGHKTGLYTSPHLQDYVERIQVNGQPISYSELAELIEEIKPAVARIPKLTTFEITTALGFLYFARQKADAAVIEVGLGGRLDATNVVVPRVSVITSLSYDHMVVLGDTLAQIAGEKAGIIKPGVPLVSAPQKDEALGVLLRVAEECHAPLTLIGRDVHYAPGNRSLDGQSLQVWTSALSGAVRYPFGAQAGSGRSRSAAGIRPSTSGFEHARPSAHLCLPSRTGVPPVFAARTVRHWRRQGERLELTIPLLGAHQVENAAVAVATLWAMRAQGLAIPDEAMRRGFAEAEWPGRFEVVRRKPPVVIDSAHNRDSALRLCQALEDYFPSWPVVLVFCALEDKDISGILAELKPRLERVIATHADHPRAPSAEWIADQVKQTGVPVEAVAPAAAALERALDLAGERMLVLAAGSVAFAGEIRAAWAKRIGRG